MSMHSDEGASGQWKHKVTKVVAKQTQKKIIQILFVQSLFCRSEFLIVCLDKAHCAQ